MTSKFPLQLCCGSKKLLIFVVVVQGLRIDIVTIRDHVSCILRCEALNASIFAMHDSLDNFYSITKASYSALLFLFLRRRIVEYTFCGSPWDAWNMNPASTLFLAKKLFR